MALASLLHTGNIPAGSFGESSIGKTSPEDNVLPSPPSERSMPVEELKLQVDHCSENDSSEPHKSIRSPDEKSTVASRDAGHDTNEDEPEWHDDGQVIKDKEGKDSEAVEETAEEISKRVSKYGHYLQMMGEQIVLWEKEMQKKISKQNESEEPAATKNKNLKRLPAIPRVSRVTWTEFKNRNAADKRFPAIEVLVGEARFYYQRRTDEKQKRDDLREEPKEETLLSTNLTSTPYNQIPERIRINSVPIIFILLDIASENWFFTEITMLPPFKFLKYFEKEIRQSLVKLEVRWTAVEKNETEPSSEAGDMKAPNEIYTNKDSNVEPTAEELMDSVEALRDMRCLVQFIDTYLKPQWQYFDTAEYHKIQFADLWHIFKPGDDVFAPLGTQTDSGSVKVGEQEQKAGQESLGPRKRNDRSQTVWRVLSTTGGRPYLSADKNDSVDDTTTRRKQNSFWLWCYYIDYNGEKFGPVWRTFVIKPFQGEKDINSLEIHPLKFARNATGIKDRLRTRGLKFCEFKSPQHRYYAGLSLAHQPNGDPMFYDEDTIVHPENIASQVVVDFGAALQEHPYWIPSISLAMPLVPDLRETDEDYPIKIWKDKERKIRQSYLEETIYNDSRIDLMLTNNFKDREPLLKDDWAVTSAADAPVYEKDLLLLPARVFGYSFRNREFGMHPVTPTLKQTTPMVLCLQPFLVSLMINNLRPTKPRKDGFNSLKLPAGYKKTVQALVHSHSINKLSNQTPADDEHDFDLVRGKGEDPHHIRLYFSLTQVIGKGLIVLLHGAPGVGKTSTAGESQR